MDLCENGGAVGFPAVGRGLQVVMGEVNVYGGDQLGDAGEAAVTHHLVRELAKEAFHEVEPGGTGGSEVNVDARVLCEPVANHRMLVRRVIVDDQM